MLHLVGFYYTNVWRYTVLKMLKAILLLKCLINLNIVALNVTVL
jgi:hypothetical protein